VTDHQPDLRHYLRILRRQGALIVGAAALAIGAAAAVTAVEQPVYRASMKIVIGQGGGTFQAPYGGAVEPFALTMSNLFKSDVVAREAIANLGLKLTPKGLLGHVNVATTPQSSVLNVAYDTSDRTRAVSTLAEMGRVFTTLVKHKLGEPLSAGTAVTATVFDPAHLEPGRVSPRPVRNVGLAALLGIAVGVVLAFVRESLDDRIRSRRDAERWFRGPVLGALPRGVAASPTGGALRPADTMTMLRANLQFREGGGGGAILVTSGLQGEGKTTLVAHLCVALAAGGNRVIGVEGDVRRPRLRQYLGVASGAFGLIDVLEGKAELAEALVDVPLQTAANGAAPGGSLQVLPSRRMRTPPGDLLTPERVSQLADELRAVADYAIFDAPPILLVGDAFSFARAADDVIVVAREGRTTKESAEAVRVTLERLGVERVAVVLTDWPSSDGYGYGYGYGSEAPKARSRLARLRG
jgi:capsular exopolysaccharide synthesis family protein